MPRLPTLFLRSQKPCALRACISTAANSPCVSLQSSPVEEQGLCQRVIYLVFNGLRCSSFAPSMGFVKYADSNKHAPGAMALPSRRDVRGIHGRPGQLGTNRAWSRRGGGKLVATAAPERGLAAFVHRHQHACDSDPMSFRHDCGRSVSSRTERYSAPHSPLGKLPDPFVRSGTQ